ncbi:tripartite motif-containing protein 2-like [Antedon mediterranea]|uniref:tripartite motif-containing protein 2-like n=1 Tax=Antedon mediterranea TaxID=105859 RepID=UPI003AF9233B
MASGGKMATGGDLAKFLEDIDEKVLECQICLNRLNEPRTLTCLHSFCLGCLDNWLKKNKKETCPTCSKSYQIPEGGLKKLPPNTFLNNLLETIEQFTNTDQTKCICGKEGKAKTYCQDCRQYLCQNCSGAHKNIRACKNHKLHSVEDVQSMSVSEINAMHPPLCSIHNEPLTVFCKICDVAICIHCQLMDHKEWEGKDKHTIISITDAFKTFKQKSAELEKVAKQCTDRLNDDLKVMTDDVTKLDAKREKSLRGIENHVEELVRRIKDSGDKLKSEVDAMYKIKRKTTDADIEDVTTTVSFINTNINLLHHLGKGNEATAMLSGNDVIRALDDRINEVSKLTYDAEIKFVKNSQQIISLQKDIGIVTGRTADRLELRGDYNVTVGESISVKIIKTDESEINTNDLKVTLTQPTGKTIIPEVEEDINGDYTVIGRCTSAGICKVDVRVDGEHIKKSPMSIKVQERLLKTIKIDNVKVRDVVFLDDNCLGVSYKDNVIHKYKESGEDIGKVTLSEGMQVNRMYTMNNGNIAFSDCSNKCITICTMNGEVIKSFGDQGVLKNLRGIHVDEASSVIYVANNEDVAMFNIESGKLIKKIAECDCTGLKCPNISDVAITRQGHILVLYNIKHCLKLFDKGGKFIKELINEANEDGTVKHPKGVVVDDDDNIIISSSHKLQLFSNSGQFIKRIDKKKDGINDPHGLCILSHHPRRLAVTNNGDKTVKIFNY